MLPKGRADDLKNWRRKLVDPSPFTSPLILLPPTLLVVDSNFVYEAVSSMVHYKPMPDGTLPRSAFEEASAVGVIVPFAPPKLIDELEKYLPEIASRTRKPISLVTECWRRIGSQIGYIQPPSLTSDNIEALRNEDPDDVPFAQLFEYINPRAILTHDTDWRRTSYPRISDQDARLFIVAIRDYGRHASSELQVWEYTKAFTAPVAIAIEVIRRNPELGLLTALGIVAIKLLSDAGNPTAKRIADGAKSFFTDGVGPVLEDVYGDALDTREKLAEASKKLDKILGALPPQPRLLLWQAALMVCAREKHSLNEQEIHDLVREFGYAARSSDNSSYLRTVLRRRSEFVEVSDMVWTVDPGITVQEA